MLVHEKYRRPCFAACAKCGEHGVIILENDDRSGHILSIEGGKAVIKDLITKGKLSKEDGDRIEDHLLCSNLVQTEGEIMLKRFLLLISKALHDNPGSSDCPHPEWN